ncbi:FAD:protein FMN transferase [Candidatus Endoriftia persephone]|jgi:thiamine biosynthesis lipoprotein|uniref:FAD:protein FMN transferase n=2 Tax=Gammaproteobacteria TaxID=1236 RepID=G2DE99_9GAMM|nr:FAD:protein FMN transferase [Candidatus Endoriftia persephone]EGV51048.1 thiamine biosynthesis lipoprotein ApbE [endosymbiont of Riftia pachyptila (vent Ph05)]USF88486.1 FAD:protein FMN transferase [Candidatus Endoriftia persephone]
MTRAVVWLLLLSLFSLGAQAQAQWLQRSADIMGTRVVIQLWSESVGAGEVAIEAVLEELRRIDRAMSPFRSDSELSRVNQQAAQGAVVISDELYGVLARAQQISELSDGAFDITFASVGHRYDYRRGIRPSEQQLEQLLPMIDYQHLVLTPDPPRLAFARPGVRIDLGGIAKGYAVDRGIAILQQHGIEHALLSAGGDSRFLGDRRGRLWRVGVRDPDDKAGIRALLPLSNTALSTSGDYERFFIQDGERYHHILNPRSGRSAKGLRSVSVLGAEAITTDALSTALFVLGRQAAMALVERLPGIEAVLVDTEGRLHFSSGLGQAGQSAAAALD